ncbi:MAG: hypothetical protein GY725_23085 [bacterium]|nr:hypothetical protein [bacterium]
MRGILVQSLVSRGVPFELALEIANKIRAQVASQGRLEIDELSKLVDAQLAEHPDIDADALPPFQDPPRVESDDSSSNPFSKGILAVSLQGAGLEPGDAYDVARELEARMAREGMKRIKRSDLRTRVAETIEQTHGMHSATRYRVWRRALDDGHPVFILLGGAAGVGKTSIAVDVARRLEIPRVIGTDSIRQIMRLMFSENLMPEIHGSTFDVHLRLTTDPDPGSGTDPLIVGFREQAQKIAVGVHALLDRAVAENTSMLIEGANLVPGIVDFERYREDAHVIFLVTASLDKEAYRSRFLRRGVRARERPAHHYIDHFAEILTIQDHILAEAENYGLPIIDNVHFDNAVLSVIRSVISTLNKSISGAV